MLAGIDTEHAMMEIVLNAYSTEEEFLMNAQCLYILRKEGDSYLKRYERLKNEINSYN